MRDEEHGGDEPGLRSTAKRVSPPSHRQSFPHFLPPTPLNRFLEWGKDNPHSYSSTRRMLSRTSPGVHTHTHTHTQTKTPHPRPHPHPHPPTQKTRLETATDIPLISDTNNYEYYIVVHHECIYVPSRARAHSRTQTGTEEAHPCEAVEVKAASLTYHQRRVMHDQRTVLADVSRLACIRLPASHAGRWKRT
jgi:hypothetical protein